MGYFSNFETLNYDINGDGIYDNITNLTSFVVASQKLLDNQTYYNYVQVMDGERVDQLSYRLYGSTKYYWTFMVINPKIKNIWDDWPKSASQLEEYSTYKYGGLAALACHTTDDLLGKFIVGEEIKGVLSDATGIVKEVHTNDRYVVIEIKSGTFRTEGEDIIGVISNDVITASAIKSAAYAPAYCIDVQGNIVSGGEGTTKVTNLEVEIEINDANKYIRAVHPSKIDEFVTEFKREIA